MSSTTKKLRGIYRRGNIFWFRHGSGKGRLQVSLGTRDEAEAIEKARAILGTPALNPCNDFLAELHRYDAVDPARRPECRRPGRPESPPGECGRTRRDFSP